MSKDTLIVHNIYRSIQGETSFAGLPCTFIRLSGCNLRCQWCDTPEAFEKGQTMTLDQIWNRVDQLGIDLVVVTGGEPLLQSNTRILMKGLCDRTKCVLLETSGERDISYMDDRVHRIMDIKTPSSGESHRNRWENLHFLNERDEVKLVLLDRHDYEWTRNVVLNKLRDYRMGEILLSCVHGRLNPQQLVAWVLEDGLQVRVQLQLHKYIWSPETKDV